MTPRTVALVRCSTAEQDTEHQRVAIEKWAEARGETIAHWYEEQGVSGAAAARPVLDEIIDAARRGRVGRLVVFELERLGRNMVRIVTTIQSLREAGCSVVDMRRNLDTQTGMGKAMLYIVGIFAEIERESLRRRTISALAGGVDEHGNRVSVRGRRLGRRPDRWDEESDAALRSCIADGLSLDKAVASDRIWVWRPCYDEKSEAWTERPAHPRRTKVQGRIKELGLR